MVDCQNMIPPELIKRTLEGTAHPSLFLRSCHGVSQLRRQTQRLLSPRTSSLTLRSTTRWIWTYTCVIYPSASSLVLSRPRYTNRQLSIKREDQLTPCGLLGAGDRLDILPLPTLPRVERSSILPQRVFRQDSTGTHKGVGST